MEQKCIRVHRRFVKRSKYNKVLNVSSLSLYFVTFLNKKAYKVIMIFGRIYIFIMEQKCKSAVSRRFLKNQDKTKFQMSRC